MYVSDNTISDNSDVSDAYSLDLNEEEEIEEEDDDEDDMTGIFPVNSSTNKKNTCSAPKKSAKSTNNACIASGIFNGAIPVYKKLTPEEQDFIEHGGKIKVIKLSKEELDLELKRLGIK